MKHRFFYAFSVLSLIACHAYAAEESASWIAAVPMVCVLQNPAYAESNMALEMKKDSRYNALFEKLKKEKDTPGMQCLATKAVLPQNACQELMEGGPNWTAEQMDLYTRTYSAQLMRTFEALKECESVK